MPLPPSDPPAGAAGAVVRDTAAMIAGAVPDRMPGTWVFATLADPVRAAALAPLALAAFREAEGLSLVLPVEAAAAAGLDTALPMTWITLRVVSALDGVGLTAAVATALAGAGIPANVVAAFHHDHVLVPAVQADAAIAVLTALAGGAKDG